MNDLILIFDNAKHTHIGWNTLVTRLIEEQIIDRYFGGNHTIIVNVGSQKLYIRMMSQYDDINMKLKGLRNYNRRDIDISKYDDDEYLFTIVKNYIEERS